MTANAIRHRARLEVHQPPTGAVVGDGNRLAQVSGHGPSPSYRRPVGKPASQRAGCVASRRHCTLDHMSPWERFHYVSATLLSGAALGCVTVWALTAFVGPSVFAEFPLQAFPSLFLVATAQWWALGLMAAIGGYGLFHILSQPMDPESREQRREEAHAGMAALGGVHFLGGLLVLLLDGIFYLEGLPHWVATVGLGSCVAAALKFRLAGGGVAVVPTATVVVTLLGWLAMPAELLAQVDSLTR